MRAAPGRVLPCFLAALLVAGLSCSQKKEEKMSDPAEGGKAIAVQVQGVEGCAAVQKTVDLIETTAVELSLAVDLELVTVTDMAQAVELKFFGSPTVLVNGVDVEPGVEDPGSYGLA
jgi:hypothetical protein